MHYQLPKIFCFINNYILPIGAAIWSTKVSSMLELPALFFINFFKNHSLLQIKNRAQWYVIKGGSNQYIEKMIDSFRAKIRLSSPVKKVVRNNEKVEIVFGTSGDSKETFDSVIFANHSNQALELLDDPSKNEKEILSSIKYQKNDVLLHSDESILPQNKSAWSSWNFFLDSDSNKPVALTYNMNILQNLKCDDTLCVSLNSDDYIDKNKIIKKIVYHHPLFTVESLKAQSRKEEINGKNNSYFCGAYWRNGFHEDGVVSALDVCKKFGGDFKIETTSNPKRFLKDWPGKIIHLTMFGISIDEEVDKIKELPEPLLFVVGAEKVPPWVFELSDYNIAIGNHPHSEVAGLSVALSKIYGSVYNQNFEGGEVKVIPSSERRNMVDTSDS